MILRIEKIAGFGNRGGRAGLYLRRVGGRFSGGQARERCKEWGVGSVGIARREVGAG